MSSVVEMNDSLEASLHASSVSMPSCEASHRALPIKLPRSASAIATSFSPKPEGVT